MNLVSTPMETTTPSLKEVRHTYSRLIRQFHLEKIHRIGGMESSSAHTRPSVPKRNKLVTGQLDIKIVNF